MGLTSRKAAEQGLPVAVGVFPLGHLGKAMATGHGEGFVKVVRHRATDALLGVHMVGHNATEVIAAAGCMLDRKVATRDLGRVILALHDPERTRAAAQQILRDQAQS